MSDLLFTGTVHSGVETFCEQYFAQEQNNRFVELCTQICAVEQITDENLLWLPVTGDQRKMGLCRALLSSQNSARPWAATDVSLALNFWLQVTNDGYFVLFYNRPEDELATYLTSPDADVSSIGDVLNAWSIRCTAMLAFHNKNPGISCLVELKSVRDTPELLAKIITQEGVTLTETTVPETTERHLPTTMVYRYIATTLLAGESRAEELYGELSAATANRISDSMPFADASDRANSLIPEVLSWLQACLQEDNGAADLEDQHKQVESILGQTQQELERLYFSERKTSQLNEEYRAYLEENSLYQVSKLAKAAKDGEHHPITIEGEE